jgi:hypothetical protein
MDDFLTASACGGKLRIGVSDGGGDDDARVGWDLLRIVSDEAGDAEGAEVVDVWGVDCVGSGNGGTLGVEEFGYD